MHGFVLHAALGVVSCAAVVQATPQATPLSETRSLYIEVQGNSLFGTDQQQVEYFSTDSGDPAFSPWSTGDTLISTGAQAAMAVTSGGIDTLIQPTLFKCNAGVESTSTVFDENAYDAFGTSTAFMQVGFSLNKSSIWNLNALTQGTGQGMAEVILSLGDTPGGQQVFRFGSDMGITHTQDFELGPGDYTITFKATQLAWALGIGQVTSTAELQAAFTLVPAPGAASVLACAGFAAARRRRAR